MYSKGKEVLINRLKAFYNKVTPYIKINVLTQKSQKKKEYISLINKAYSKSYAFKLFKITLKTTKVVTIPLHNRLGNELILLNKSESNRLSNRHVKRDTIHRQAYTRKALDYLKSKSNIKS